jgi:MFS family permease
VSDDPRSTERRATFGEVFGVAEYRAVFVATLLSWIGDYMARAAVMALVFVETGSMAATGAAFAVSYLPWLIGGPFLSAVAERYRYRGVMVACDLLRAGLVVGVALVAGAGLSNPTGAVRDGGVPGYIWLMVGLLFLVALLAAPAQAARSAIMPLILPGDRVTLGLALNNSTGQFSQVVGFMIGALIAITNPILALLINAVAFTLSGLIIRLQVRDRLPAMRFEQRSNLLREMAEGFQIVFGSQVLRSIALMVFASMLFAIVPEGLAIGWAEQLAEGDPSQRGFYQGLIMIANPVGNAIAALLIIRLLRPSLRRQLVRFFAVAAPLVLVPALVNPGIAGVVTMTLVSGLAIAGMFPILNGVFVQALRHGYRARAFGIMATGVQVIQGAAVLVTGVLVQVAGRENLHIVVGLWSLTGVALMVFLAGRWPKSEMFSDAIATAEAANADEAAREPAHAARPEPARTQPTEPGGATGEADLPARHRHRHRHRRATPATDPPTV